MKTERDFTTGPLLGPLLKFSLPVLAALFLQTMYGAVDLLIVGQFATSADVSAVSTGSMIMNTATFLITGTAMGMTIQIGHFIGEKKPREAGRLVGSGITLFAGMALVLTVLMMAFPAPIARLMQAPEDAFEPTVDYIRICSAGFLFIAGYNVLGGVFRGAGDANMPLISVAIACVVNIGGDLLLVRGFGMGAAGAAAATVGAQGVSVLLSLVIIRFRKMPFTMEKRDLRPDHAMISRILKLGTPVALQDILVNISFLVVQAIVNNLGVVASAGVGVAEKLCGFIMLAPSAFSQSVSTFTAQNVGAGRHDRARTTLRLGIMLSLSVGVVMAWLAFFHGEALCRIFSQDAEVVHAGGRYLRAYAIDTLLTSFLFCFLGFYNGYGRTGYVMLQGLVGAFCVRIPASWLLSRVAAGDVFIIGLATPCSSLVQICLAFVYLLRFMPSAWKPREDAAAKEKREGLNV